MYHSHYNCVSYNNDTGHVYRARQPFTESHATQIGAPYHKGRGVEDRYAKQLIARWNRIAFQTTEQRKTVLTYYLES